MKTYVLFAIILGLNLISVTAFASDSLVPIESRRAREDCVSGDKICLTKCCPAGHFLARKNQTKTCVPSPDLPIPRSDMTVYNAQCEPTDKSFKDVFQLTHNNISEKIFGEQTMIIKDIFVPYLIENGDLYLEAPNMFERWRLISHDRFCVEVTNKSKKYFIFVPMTDVFDDVNYLDNMEYALPLSVLFLVLTLVPYCVCSQLRDLDAAILVTFVCFFTVPLAVNIWCKIVNYTVTEYISIALLYTFCSLSSLCWTNVMFWRLRASSSIKNVSTSEIKQYFKYCIYTFSIPLSLTAVMAAAELADLSHVPWFITPQLIKNCNDHFLTKESLIYLHAPLLLQLLFNWVMCVMRLVDNRRTVVVNITRLPEPDKAPDSPLTRASTYVSFLVVLTVYCGLRALGAYCPDGTGAVLVHMLTILYTSIGPLMFIIFVLNINSLKIIFKNCCCRNTTSYKYKNYHH